MAQSSLSPWTLRVVTGRSKLKRKIRARQPSLPHGTFWVQPHAIRVTKPTSHVPAVNENLLGRQKLLYSPALPRWHHCLFFIIWRTHPASKKSFWVLAATRLEALTIKVPSPSEKGKIPLAHSLCIRNCDRPRESIASSWVANTYQSQRSPSILWVYWVLQYCLAVVQADNRRS